MGRSVWQHARFECDARRCPVAVDVLLVSGEPLDEQLPLGWAVAEVTKVGGVLAERGRRYYCPEHVD